MFRLVLGFTVSVFVFVTFNQVAMATIEQKPSAFVLCKNQKKVRTIRILSEKQNDQQGCTVTYTKGGVDEVVGSNRSSGTCQSILKNIQQNLESSNWSCRSVQAGVVSSKAVSRQ